MRSPELDLLQQQPDAQRRRPGSKGS